MATAASPTEDIQWCAFLSSLVREHGELRRRIYELGRQRGCHIYVDERFHDRGPIADDDHLDITDELIERVRATPLFLCILCGPRHGSPIKVGGRESSVSFFEAELYQAALLQKRVHVFELPGFSPEPRLKAMLDMLRFALPPDRWQTISSHDVDSQAKQVVQTVERLADDAPAQVPTAHRRSLLRRLVHGLWLLRGAPSEFARGETELFFLDNRFEAPPGPLQLELVDQLMSDSMKQPDQQRKLTRIWLAVRELMKVPYQDDQFSEFRPLWNHVLGRWASAGSWYSLHGHMYMGCLAAVMSEAAVRDAMRARHGGKPTTPEEEHPAGPLATAHYSIAQLLTDSRGRAWHLDRAERHINSSLANSGGDISGLLAIRGSIHWRNRRVFRAVADYKEVLRLRERAHEEAGRIGEAMSELGFGYMFTGRLLRGRSLLKRGVEMLRSREDTGFLVRALRKSALADFFTGHWLQAYEDRSEARDLAARSKLIDQLK
jgi:hypothetical protein